MKRTLGALAILFLIGAVRADEPKLVPDQGLSFVAETAIEMIGDATSGGASQRPRLSADGRLVAFESTARLVEEDRDRLRDVYLYDRSDRTYRRLHRPSGAVAAAGVTVSGDGTYAAYHVNEVTPRQGVEPVTAILLVHLESGNTRRIPQPWRGESVKGEALFPEIGHRGAQMIFSSNGVGLSGRAATPLRQVYVFDRVSDEIRLVSRSDDSLPANRTCAEPELSDDGRFAAYLSAATNLAGGLPPDSLAYRLYVVDRSSGTTIRVDEIERGFDPQGWVVGTYDMDASGDNIVFEARARKPGKPHDSLATTDLFLFERSSGAVTRMTSGIFAGRSHSPSVSGDGRFTVFAIAAARGKKDSGGIVVYDRSRELWRMAANGRAVNPTISADGRVIAFESGDNGISMDKRSMTRVFVLPNPSYEETNGDH